MNSRNPIHDGPAEVAPGAQWLRATLLLVIAVCTYLHVPLLSGGRLLVPSFPTVALTPILFLVVWRDLTLTDLMFVLKVAFVLLLSIAFSPGYAHIEEKFVSMIQFLMAVAVALLIVRLMKQLSPTTLERTLLVLWCLILGGSILEVLDVIRAASDAFRARAYEELYGLYEADLRDVNLLEGSDSDGDPTFAIRLVLADGRELRLHGATMASKTAAEGKAREIGKFIGR